MEDIELGEIGSSFDQFLKGQDIAPEVSLIAVKRVLAFALAKEIEEQGISKAEFARRMGGHRKQVYKILDPEDCGITMETMNRAARALGRRLIIGLE